MPHAKFLALSILFSIGMVRSPASAQTIPSPYTYIENHQELAFFVGKSNIDAGKLELGPRDSDTFGARYSVGLGGAISIDISGTLFKSTRLIQDVRRPIDDRTINRGNIDLLLFDARLRLNLTGRRMWHGFQPFLTFGGGLAFPYLVDNGAEEVAFMRSQDRYVFGLRFTGTTSGGTTFHVSRKLSLRVEGMLNLWQIKTPIGWFALENDPLRLFSESEWVTAQSIMLGASWRFWRQMPDFESRTGDWLPFDRALARILSHVSALPPETVPLEEALGRALALDVLAPGPLPPWDNSAMDGYAVRGDDVAGATKDQPVVLVVTGVIHAGSRFEGTVGPGDAVRIMTGAEVPGGADTVIRVEDTDREETKSGNLRIYSERDRGRHVRPAGQDWPEGAVTLESGTGIGPGQAAVLAASRVSSVSVHHRPKVSILASGDELVDIESQALDPHGIPESNSHLVSAGVRAAGGIPVRLGIARDDRADIRHHLARAADADVLVTLGGASMGEGDLFKTVLEDLGFELDFWRVKIRPGSPMSFGRLPLEGGGSQTVFGLPGNPASAFVTFELFVRPFLLALAGHIKLHRQIVTALAAGDLTTAGDVTGFLRVCLARSGAELEASLTGPQGSGLVGSLGAADGLAVIPEGVEVIPRGAPVEVMLLDDPRSWSHTPVDGSQRIPG